MGVWRHRIAKDAGHNTLHFVCARYDDVDPYTRVGMTVPHNEGHTVDDMRALAHELLRACDEPVISTRMLEQEPEPAGDS